MPCIVITALIQSVVQKTLSVIFILKQIGMKKNRIRLTEADITRIVAGVLNEKFSRQSMKDAVKQHGGLDRGYLKNYDARMNSGTYDLSEKEAYGVLPKQTIDELNKAHITFNKPLDEQLLFCNDGCAIVVYPYGSDYWDFNDKLQKRQEHWYDEKGSDNGKKKASNDWGDSGKHADRRVARARERGVKKVRGQKPVPEQD